MLTYYTYAYVLCVLMPSPAVNLLVDIVKPLVKLLDLSFLPLDVRAVLLEFSSQIITAAFGRTQVLFRLRDH